MPRQSRSKRRSRPNKRKPTKTVTAPASKAVAARRTEAKVSSSGSTVRIRHREMFEAAVPSAGPVVYAITPSNAVLFPWLAQMAPMYQYFRINSLRAEYVPSCPTTTTGTVWCMFDYNIHDKKSGTNYAEYSQTQGFKDCPVYGRLTNHYDKAQALVKDRLFLGTPPTGADSAWYRAGVLMTGTSINTGTAVHGRWYVVYDITFLTPQPLAGPVMASTTVFEFNAVGSAPSNILGTTNATPDVGDAAYVANGNVHFTKPGDFLLTVCQNGTGGMDAATPSCAISGGASATLTDTIVQTGLKTVFQFFLSNVVAGAIATISKSGQTGAVHTDIDLALVDGTLLRTAQTRRLEQQVADERLASRVASLIMAETPEEAKRAF